MDTITTFAAFLLFLLTSAGAGLAVTKTIDGYEQFMGHELDVKFKFVAAVVLSFVFPVVAYLLEIWIGTASLSNDGLFGAFVIGYITSQGFHRAQEKHAEAAQAREGGGV
jgi:hypothetical protein